MDPRIAILFDGTSVRYTSDGWVWQNHGGSWEPVAEDSVLALAIETDCDCAGIEVLFAEGGA